MTSRGRWRIAAALASGIAVTVAASVALAAGPAGAASASQWRTASVWGTANGSFNSVAATSKASAWAVGGATSGPLAAHWNGHAWQTVTVPGSKGWAFMQVLAPTAGNVWIYAVNNADPFNPVEAAFRFDGAHWHTVLFPAGLANFGSLAVLGPNDAWFSATPLVTTACSSFTGPCTDVWHYNGTTWKDYTIRANITGLAGVSDSAMWAVGIAGTAQNEIKGVVAAYRWNGHVFARANIPHVTGYWPGVAIHSAGDLWISYDNVAVTRGYTQHWNGSRWQVVNASNGPNDPPVPDGRGGAWFGAFLHWTGSTFIHVPLSPANLQSYAWSLQAVAVVPGTNGASAWSAGWLEPGNVQHPVVAIYGPAP